MRGKLIVFEGTDSSGKKTQVGLLEKRLKEEGRKFEVMGFPTYEKTKLGEMVGRYLKGDFGTKEEVGPEIGSMFFMMDRYQFKDKLWKTLKDGTTIIMDRYTPSNIYQAAETEGAERFRIWEWVKNVDSRLPRPDTVVFLNVPPEVSEKLFAQREAKNPLIGNAKDILEKDRAYQEKVRLLYLEVAKREGWIIIECTTNGQMRKPEEIHEEICWKLKEKGAF
jgi:dTMP kinase